MASAGDENIRIDRAPAIAKQFRPVIVFITTSSFSGCRSHLPSSKRMNGLARQASADERTDDVDARHSVVSSASLAVISRS